MKHADLIIRLYAVLAWASAFTLVLAGLAAIFFLSLFMTITHPMMQGIATLVGVALIIIAAAYTLIGFGLWYHKPWARIAALVVACLSIFSIPFGTVVGGFGIYCFGFDKDIIAEFSQKKRSVARKRR